MRRVDGKFMTCPNCQRWGPKGVCQHCGFDTTAAGAAASLRARSAVSLAKRRAFWQRVYHFANGLFHLHGHDFWAFIKTGLKWGGLGGSAGVLAGIASAVFLISLNWATQVRIANPQIIILLPFAGFLVAWIYARFGGKAVLGNNLVIDEVNHNRSRIPLRMAPLVLMGTVATHLFGGSAGREGTAIQMGASLADGLQRLFRLAESDRRLMIMAGISGGFGSVFGVPVAGFAFGLEVQNVGRMRYEGMIPCLVAAYVGDWVTRALGAPHSHYPALVNVEIDPLTVLQVLVAGILFGVTSLIFIELTHGVKYLLRRITAWTPVHSLIGGFVVLGLTYWAGTTAYLGLSLPLIQHSLDGTGVITFAFLLKLIFTSVTLGSGYLGGEVTPLFVVGATLGYTLGGILGINPAFLASIGMVAVFAGASNTPLASALMGIELFGGGSALYLFLGTVVAYLASGHRGIYTTQPIVTPKAPGVDVISEENIATLSTRRGGGWLPPITGLVGKLGEIPVRAFMSARVTTVFAETPLDQLAMLAYAAGVRSIPVVNLQKQVIGIVTDQDLRRSGIDCSLRLFKAMHSQERTQLLNNLRTRKTQEIMSSPVRTVTQTDSLIHVSREMKAHRLKRMPVVDDTGQLVGVVTRSDVLRQIAFAAPVLLTDANVHFNPGRKVGELSLQTCCTVTTGTTLAEAIQQMRHHAQRRLVVLDEAGHVAGIVTDTDILARAANALERNAILSLLQTGEQTGDMLWQPVANKMTTPVITVTVDHTMTDAIRLLLEHGIKRLPVLNEEGQVVGLIGRDGLFKAVLAEPVSMLDNADPVD